MNRRKTPIPFPDTGKQIRYYRQLRGYSAAQLAQYIEIDSKYLSNLESGHQMPGFKILQRLSIVLNVSIEQLLSCQSQDDPAADSASLRNQIIADISKYSDNEIEILHSIMCEIIPRVRKFKEY